MIPQLGTALARGFNSNQIISMLLRKFPQHQNKIQQAIASGFSAEQILKFITKGRKGLSEEHIPTTEHQETRSEDIRRREAVNQSAANIAKAGALAGGAALAAPMAMGALQRAAPQLVGPGSILGVQAPTVQQTAAQVAGATPAIPTPPPMSPTPEAAPFAVTGQMLNKFPGFQQKINDLLKSGNGPEAISVYFKKFNPSETSKLEKELGKPIEEIIGSYVAQEQEKPQSMESQGQELDVSKKEIGVAPIEKGHNVLSPQGMGEVREIRNGQAIIEIDGKKHKVSEDELIQSPIPEKELADLYEDLISGIEKTTGKQVSRNVDWAGYDPNTNELAYKPHGSDKLYAYEDISPKDVEMLTSLLTQRKSTGENFIGAWSAGTESPIGAAMYQLIKKLQAERGGKGSEYKNKYETIYDALEPAKKAAKERHAERKKKTKKPRFD